jgi:serine phosphatase RsbU (regulator of sigma subunit)/DNA-binding transcriptional regulator YhcF (GntR family)
MLLNLTDLSAEPLHRQISGQLARRILDGELEAGAGLPSPAAMARKEHISRSTVELAYKELAREGLIRVRQPKGPVVCDVPVEERRAAAARLGAGTGTILSAIEAFSERLMSIVDKRKMCSILLDSITRYLRPRSACVAWPDRTEARWHLLAEAGARTVEFDPDGPVMEVFLACEGPIPVSTEGGDGLPERLQHELRKHGADLVLPIKHGNALLGILALGYREGLPAYSEDDLNLIGVFINQLAAALAMADMYADCMEKRRMEHELEAARRIQAHLLPKTLKHPQGLDVAAFTSPAGTVGGDFYDYFPMDSSHVGLIIADACGNGVPAAMLISQIQAILKNDALDGRSIEHTLSHLNRHLQDQAEAGFFATLFYGIVDMETGSLEYANAGHDFPILVRRNGRTETLTSTGPALGVVPDLAHETGRTRLGQGDCLVLYTDGITETTSPKGKHYGEARLKDLAIRCRHRSPEEIMACIKYDVERFGAPEPFEDDMTVVVVKASGISVSEYHAA